MAYLGLYALQHRGQESAGIATADLGAMFVERDMGMPSRCVSRAVMARSRSATTATW